MGKRRAPHWVGQQIMNELLSEVPGKDLYHYTNQSGLLGIIRNQEIWATHHQCLNDIGEFVHAKNLLREELAKRLGADPLVDEMYRIVEKENSLFEGVNLYVASFSEEPDSLSQWRAYGGPSSGFSLGFRTDSMVLSPGFTMVRCLYKEKTHREIIATLVEEILTRLHGLDREIYENAQSVKPFLEVLPRSVLHTFALIFKHEKFEAEKEWRIISSDPMMEDPPGEGEAPLDFREGKSILTPYRRVKLKDTLGCFPLTEVFVGPNPHKEQSIRSVRSLLSSQALRTCRVIPSEVTYRNW
jgi:hypothetical protein